MCKKYEYCFLCDQPTGRAGGCEDSIYIEDDGPFCEACYKSFLKGSQQMLAKCIEVVKKAGLDPKDFDMGSNCDANYFNGSSACQRVILEALSALGDK